MKITRLQFLFMMLSLLGGLGGCVGTQTFTTAARSGETVTLAVGWRKTLDRQNMTITFTPAATGVPVTYLPNDAGVRSVFNLYPDPVSKLVVGTQTGQTLGTDALRTGNGINSLVTGGDRDWWQSMVMLDLPTLPTGLTTIQINDSLGAAISPISIEILPGTSPKNSFPVKYAGSTVTLTAAYAGALRSMERADRSTITFTGSTIPHSMHMTFAHTPNVGKTWVVNPRGDIKNLAWTDDGANITVVLTPAQGITLSRISDFKFYIAGGISGLTQTNLKAYDVNGYLMAGVTAAVQ